MMNDKTDSSKWAGAAAMAGAAIGSAALAAALLYTSRRKERDQAASRASIPNPPETD
jgi:Na+/H+-translocating membrane pyrophosphatase